MKQLHWTNGRADPDFEAVRIITPLDDVYRTICAMMVC